MIRINIPHASIDEDDSSSTGSLTPSCSSLRSDESTAPSEPWQCKYTGKICMNARARKTNGKLHRLCQEHRIRANINQRRLQMKRRLARAEMAITPYPLDCTIDDEDLLDEGWESWVSTILQDGTLLQQPHTINLTAPEPLNVPGQLTDEDVEWLSLLFISAASDETKHDLQPYQAMRLFTH